MTIFPHIRKLTILHPTMEPDEMECMDANVKLAKLQHALKRPFEHVVVHMSSIPTGNGGGVGAVGWCIGLPLGLVRRRMNEWEVCIVHRIIGCSSGC
jgi:hypothetical protein